MEVVDRAPPTARAKTKARVAKECVICGRRFLVTPNHAPRYSTCSRQCSTERRRRAREVHPREITCERCGQRVPRRRYRQRYCSNECRLAALNGQPRVRRDGFLSPHIARGYVRGRVWRDGKLVGMAEHRHVMEQHLGRRLTPEERVHHINGDRTDNRIANLKLYPSHRAHLRAEHPELVVANARRSPRTRPRRAAAA